MVARRDGVFGMAGDLEVTRHRLGLGVRLALLTDLHLDRTAITAERVARVLDAAAVEVVALGGDFFDRRYLPDRLDLWLDALGRRPAVAVLGNHDHRLAPGVRAALVARLEARVVVLRNEAAEVGGLRVFGYDDPVTQRAAPVVPASPMDVVLAHSVDLPVPLAALPAPLLCGHYHGGQVRVLPGRLLAHLVLRREPLALATGQLAGWTPDRRAYIGRGLGMSHVAVRVRSAPEIAVFD
jgi:predicted MPP superfamily phosphohydrolase